MLRKLRNKLTVMCATATAVILCAMAATSLYISEKDFQRTELEAFQNTVDALVLYLRSNSVIDNTYLAQYETGNHLLLHIEDNGHSLVFGGRSREKRNELIALLTQTPDYSDALARWEGEIFPSTAQSGVLVELTDLGGESYHAQVVNLSLDTGNLRLFVFGDTALLWEGILRRRVLFACAVVAAVGLLALFSWWFSGRAIAPVAEGQRQQSEFIAAVSHEMRTPLAAIQASVESLGIAESDRDRQRFTSIIGRECGRTNRLVGDMLTLASIDSQGWRLEKDPVELPELLEQVLEPYRPIGDKKLIQWRVRLPALPRPIAADAVRLQQVLGILLDNAIRYTPTGGKIVLSATQTARNTHLRVADSGPGMADAQKTRAFTRFYRADSARTGGEHYGLGLSIARELVELHGGKIVLEDTPGGGLTVHIIL